MKCLLDVNALVALAFIDHEFHDRVVDWVKVKRPIIVTSAITELGFVRVLSQAPSYGISIAEARTLLGRLKKNKVYPFTFLADDHDISHLPRWVKSPRQTTNGHLIALAHAHEAVLVTLDGKIPGAYLIP